ncbi:MAG TPA: metalloregulator ArsR/SmtB family transcription factor [Thermomicrobiales bacterium]|nr:metalloregulator ArsR/SmtB family transcription factor [Thermomicrobiales bacterium]
MARPRKIDQITESRDDACEDRIVHVDAVREARVGMPSAHEVASLSAMFSILGDPTRLRIIAALRGREMCVCDIAASVGQSESAVSHQLRVLREQNLVRARKNGRRRYYVLDDEHVEDVIRMALAHVAHEDGEGSVSE